MKIRLLVAAALALCAFYVFRVPRFASTPAPAKTFQEAMAKFSALQKEEEALPLRPEGRSRIFSHGKKTARVFVLLHGLTNCPEQFVPLARILFDSGANVVLPRARYAGYADRLNDLQGLQSGQDLLDQAAVGLDIAAGLGDRVSLVGLSGSAVAAAWMAENREGIESVLLLSPFFSLYGHPVWMIDFLSAVLSKLPNFYKWWNDDLQDKLPGPPYVYPRYGSRCMADTVQLSRNVRANMDRRPLQCGRMDILITGTDVGANNNLSRKMEEDWNARSPGSVTLFEFPKQDGVPHDMVDRFQPDQKTAISYPKILQLLSVSPSARP